MRRTSAAAQNLVCAASARRLRWAMEGGETTDGDLLLADLVE